jgi:hypothetical protein
MVSGCSVFLQEYGRLSNLGRLKNKKDSDPERKAFIFSMPIFMPMRGVDPLELRDPSGKFIIEAFVGAGVGAAFGALNGALHGETASQIENDAIAGGLTGAVIGLTDGFALLDGYAGVGLRAGWSAAVDAKRTQKKHRLCGLEECGICCGRKHIW